MHLSCHRFEPAWLDPPPWSESRADLRQNKWSSVKDFSPRRIIMGLEVISSRVQGEREK